MKTIKPSFYPIKSRKVKIFIRVIILASAITCNLLPFGEGWGEACFAQNIGINTDGSAPETGVMLDIKAPSTNAKATTAAVQSFFQLKSFDDDNSALKLRFGFKTDATQANRYGFLDFLEAGTPTYLNLALQPSGGNVGIGTTAPIAKLHSLATTEQLRLGYDASNYTSFTTASNGDIFVTTAGTSGSFQFGNILGNINFQYKTIDRFGTINMRGTGFTIANNSTELHRFESNGNVGIGTTSPAYNLDINGTAGFRNDVYLFNTKNLYFRNAGDASVTALISADASNILTTTSVANLINQTQSNLIFKTYNNASAYTTRFTIETNGAAATSNAYFQNVNVGIGTTTPRAALNVTGGGLRIDGYTGGGTTGSGLELGWDGTNSNILSYNRATGTNLPMWLQASLFDFHGGDINLETGYGVKINNTATSGQYLRGDGTRFVSSAIQASDLPSSFSGLANPSATLGLTAINGTATTAMRSDGAPALSQAIVPTWTGTHTFSNATYSALFTGGNMGIGTATPGAKLHVSGGNILLDNNRFVQFKDNAGAVKNILSVDPSDQITLGIFNGLNSTYLQAGGSIYFSSGNDYRMVLNTNGLSINNSSTGATAGNGLVVASGNVGIGTTGPVSLLNAEGSGSANELFRVSNDINATKDSVMVFTSAGNVGIGTASPTYKLHVNGKIKTDDIDETSDIRLKKNIITINNALSKVEAMRGVYFNWRSDEFKNRNFDTTLQMGVIAQEIEKIIPEVVSTDPEGFKSVEYSKMVAILIEAIKEQQKIIDNIKSENKIMKSSAELQNEQMKSLINALLQKGILQNSEINAGIITTQKNRTQKIVK